MTKQTEFNLSEKIVLKDGKDTIMYLRAKDVKEFIRLCEDNSEEINGKSYIKISKMQRFAGNKLK